MSGGPPDLYNRPGRADTGSPRQLSATTPAAPPPMAGVSQTPKDTDGGKAAKKNAPDPDKSEIELVRAKTMHQMVNVIPGENIKVMYLTNQQANLIASDTANIMKMLNAFEVNPNSQLVIRFLPTSGASHSLESGILPGFKHLFSKDGTTRLSYETHPEEYTEAWKDLLKVQAKNNEKAGIGADFLPIPPYTAFEGQGETEWGLECFMREVLVPLAAETQAMVIGSGFKDDSMMMMFAKVADALSSKYGGVTSVPWTTFGFADAPSLAMACCEPSSSAYAVFKQCPAWQLKYKRVLKAKILMKRKAQQGAAQKKDEDEDDITDEHLDDAFDENLDILYDLNPHVENLIIVGNVEVQSGRPLAINAGPQRMLETVMTDYLVSIKSAIGIGTLHAKYSYMGMLRMANWLHMGIPVLVLDARPDRKPYTCKHPEDPEAKQQKQAPEEQMVPMAGEDPKKFEQRIQDLQKKRVLQLRSLFEEIRQNDLKLEQELEEHGKLDPFEMCRLAHFHATLFPKGKEAGSDPEQPLFEAIQLAFEAAQSFKDDEASKLLVALKDEIVEYLVDREFKTYWNLKPKAEIDRLMEAGTLDADCPWRSFYKMASHEARAAIHTVLSHERTFSAHVNDISGLDFVVNQLMMKKNSLPDSDTLESLLILRSAWDVVDISRHVLRGYKILAKVLYVIVVIFGIVHPSVVVFQTNFDQFSIALPDGSSMAGSQFVIFMVSVVTAFFTAIMSMYNPQRRWQQIRDAEMTMRSAIWQYRTRTGPYACSKAGDSIDANIALRDMILHCRQQILGQADMGETNFYKKYPLHIYIHGQRSVPGQPPFQEAQSIYAPTSKGNGNKIVPDNKGKDGQDSTDEPIILDLEAAADTIMLGEPDNHHAPLKPEAYIRLRLFNMLNFYRTRLPGYAKFHDRGQFLVLAASVVSAIIAYLNYAREVAIVSAISAGVAGYLEWSSVGRKVGRYNGSIVEIENLILWWDSMSTVEKGAPHSVNNLVAHGESIINGERGSWLAAPAKEGGEEGEGDKDDEKADKKDA